MSEERVPVLKGLVVALMALMMASGVDGACEMLSACSCRADDGSVLDLSPAVSDFYDATAMRYVSKEKTGFIAETYYFNPCKDATLQPKDEIVNMCKSVSICKRELQFTSNVSGSLNGSGNVTDSGYEAIASVSNAKFGMSIDGIVSLAYEFNDVKVSINLVCTTYKSSKLLIIDSSPNAPVLTFYSPHACFSDATTHHSLGTTLIIILFVLVLVYLLAGCCVKHFLMGARGVEIIPNLNFWKDLPSLVKDGVDFIKNGFKPPPPQTSTPNSNPNPNTYDSI